MNLEMPSYSAQIQNWQHFHKVSKHQKRLILYLKVNYKNKTKKKKNIPQYFQGMPEDLIAQGSFKTWQSTVTRGHLELDMVNMQCLQEATYVEVIDSPSLLGSIAHRVGLSLFVVIHKKALMFHFYSITVCAGNLRRRNGGSLTTHALNFK